MYIFQQLIFQYELAFFISLIFLVGFIVLPAHYAITLPT